MRKVRLVRNNHLSTILKTDNNVLNLYTLEECLEICTITDVEKAELKFYNCKKDVVGFTMINPLYTENGEIKFIEIYNYDVEELGDESMNKEIKELNQEEECKCEKCTCEDEPVEAVDSPDVPYIYDLLYTLPEKMSDDFKDGQESVQYYLGQFKELIFNGLSDTMALTLMQMIREDKTNLDILKNNLDMAKVAEVKAMSKEI